MADSSHVKWEKYISYLPSITLPSNLQIEHYLQIVKTEIVSRRSSKEYKLLEEYEYTAHSSLVHSLSVPVAKFHFEPSPMQVGITLRRLE